MIFRKKKLKEKKKCLVCSFAACGKDEKVLKYDVKHHIMKHSKEKFVVDRKFEFCTKRRSI